MKNILLTLLLGFLSGLVVVTFAVLIIYLLNPVFAANLKTMFIAKQVQEDQKVEEPSQTEEEKTETEADVTADWKTHESKALGLQFKYPSDMKVVDTTSSNSGEKTVKVKTKVVDDVSKVKTSETDLIRMSKLLASVASTFGDYSDWVNLKEGEPKSFMNAGTAYNFVKYNMGEGSAGSSFLENSYTAVMQLSETTSPFYIGLISTLQEHETVCPQMEKALNGDGDPEKAEIDCKDYKPKPISKYATSQQQIDIGIKILETIKPL
ncbi:hypothetical protein IT417_00575 [bacterium]|nr:hypothetical protein [bacterium]